MSESAPVERTEEPATAEVVVRVCTGCGELTSHDVLRANEDGSTYLKCQVCGSEDSYPERATTVQEQGERIAAMVKAEAERADADEPTPEKAAPVMQHDPYTRTCPTCAGFGVTLTGSQVDGQEVRECPDCRARGWQEKLEQITGIPAAGEAPHPDADAWKWG